MLKLFTFFMYMGAAQSRSILVFFLSPIFGYVFCSRIYLFVHPFIHSFVRSFNCSFFKSHSLLFWKSHQPFRLVCCLFLFGSCARHTRIYIHSENDSIFLSVLKSKRYFVCCARNQRILNDFMSLCNYFHYNLNSIQALLPVPHLPHLHMHCDWIVSTSYIRHIL